MQQSMYCEASETVPTSQPTFTEFIMLYDGSTSSTIIVVLKILKDEKY